MVQILETVTETQTQSLEELATAHKFIREIKQEDLPKLMQIVSDTFKGIEKGEIADIVKAIEQSANLNAFNDLLLKKADFASIIVQGTDEKVPTAEIGKIQGVITFSPDLAIAHNKDLRDKLNELSREHNLPQAGNSAFPVIEMTAAKLDGAAKGQMFNGGYEALLYLFQCANALSGDAKSLIVIGRIDKSNIASIKLTERNGFVLLGESPLDSNTLIYQANWKHILGENS